MYISSLPKHNLSMHHIIFSSQIEDSQQPASNQTGAPNDNNSEDEGPDDRCSRATGAGLDEEASGDDAGRQDNNINPHRRTMRFLFAIPLLLK